MLKIKIQKRECWDSVNERFVYIPETTLELEHSLFSISKWEAKWEKSFFLKEPKTSEETIDYIKMMSLNDVDPIVFNNITKDVFKQIEDYINMPMTATKINSRTANNKESKSYMTSEIIYYYMVTLNIPLECEHWHINRLITLIRVCSIKAQPQKKMSTQEAIAYQAKLNAERRAKMKSKG